jgi:hypothetical protein
MLRLLTTMLLALALPQVPANSALIVGRVLDQADQKPVGGAVVEIASVAVINGVVPASANPPRRQMTDALGRFVFRELPGDVYTVRVTVGGTGFSPYGYIQNGSGFRIGEYLDGGYGQRRPGGPLQPMVVSDGQTIPDLVVHLWRGAALNGTVIDDLGEPVVDTVVGAVRVSSDGRLIDGPTDRTDDRGMYRFSALEPGRYVVFVPQTTTAMSAASADAAMQRLAELAAAQKPGAPMPPVSQLTGFRVGDALVTSSSSGFINGNMTPRREGDAVFVFETTFHPGTASLASAAAVELAAGEDRQDVDVSVRPVRAAAVTGTVLANGQPASGVRVRLAPSGASPDASMFETAVAQTDALGRFTFPLVPEGNYIARAFNDAAPARPPSTTVVHSAGEAGGPGAWFSEPVGVGPDGVKDLVFTMKPGYTVRGHLEFVGSGAAPSAAVLAKVLISLRSAFPRARADSSGGGAQSLWMDGNRFSAVGLPPGRYLVRVSGFEPGSAWRIESVVAAGRESNDIAIDVAEDLDDVRVVLTDTPASVSGRVTTADPGDGATVVLLFPADRSLWPDARALTRRFRMARTSASGDFAMTDVPPGEYLSVAMPDADAANWPDVGLLNRLLPEATSVRVDPRQRQTLALTAKVIR